MLALSIKAPARVHGEITLPPGMHAVVGASGSGKTSLFRLIAGLDRSPGIRVDWQDQNLAILPPYLRSSAFVPQRPSLVSHRTIAQQVLWVAADVNGMWRQWIEWLELHPLWSRFPGELSGGEQQRAALLRALAADRSMLLLDEALSQIDRPHRLAIYRRLKSQLAPERLILFSTHHWEEAETFADSVLFIRHGRIEGPIRMLEAKPLNPDMAAMMGYIGSIATPHGHLLIHPATIAVGSSAQPGWTIPGSGRQLPVSPTLSHYRFVPAGPVQPLHWSGSPQAEKQFDAITVTRPIFVSFELDCR